ncbi:unnamed protein product [Ixodes hexagonus]
MIYIVLKHPLFRFRLGLVNVVVLNDFASIKKYLSMEATLNRSHRSIFEGVTNGMTTLSGPAWVENRRFCLRVLKDLGFGKKTMEEHIKVRHMQRVLYPVFPPGDAAPVLPGLQRSTFVLILPFCVRHLYPLSDPRAMINKRLLSHLGRLQLFSSSQHGSRQSRSCGTALASIGLYHSWFASYLRERVKEHQGTIDPNFNRDFIDGYLNKVREHQNNPNSHFREAYLLGNAIDFFVAGTGTVAASVQWHLLNCAKHADTVQSVIQREIDNVIGREREPTWEDRSQMHFTMACVWEMLRWRTVVPLGLPRGYARRRFYNACTYLNYSTQDTVIKILLPVFWYLEDIFEPTYLLLYLNYICKRMCPAEALTTVEIFLYLTTLLQKFRVLPEGQQLPNLGSPSLTVAHPSLQRLRFIPR